MVESDSQVAVNFLILESELTTALFISFLLLLIVWLKMDLLFYMMFQILSAAI